MTDPGTKRLNKSILYCGDTDLNSAASYLAGLMSVWGWTFDYVPSHVAMSAELLEQPRSLLILSDYPAAQFDAALQLAALRQIEQGAGLLMIGGWESFHGFGGNWDGTPLGSVLPVMISSTDDRTNFDQSAWLTPVADHPITQELPWQVRPPAIGGMNRVSAKPGANVILNAQTFKVTASSSRPPQWTHSASDVYPALVVGHYGLGRTAAFMSDVAPHWVGGFVDWGLPRVTGQAASSVAIEVGSQYAQFWKQLLLWTSGEAVD